MTELERASERELDTIASGIRREVEAAETAWGDAMGHAIRAGDLLTEAKSKVRHGEWLPWLEANFPGSERSARNYMRLAKNRQQVADLPTIREAVAALAEAKPPSEADELQADHDNTDEHESRLEREARAMVTEKHDGCDIGSHLFEAEVHIQTALLHRRESAHAALELARMYAAGRPQYAAACADLAAVMLDEDSGPWDERESEVQERWLAASAQLHEEES